MSLPQEKHYTIEDIENLPEGERAELIDGRIYNMSAQSSTHQRISGFLSNTIWNHIIAKKGRCEVFTAPFAVYILKDDYNYVEPDISVICDKNKITEKGCNGAPDWIIEITSPSNAGHDYITKSSFYQNADVKEYWIVNPQKESITVFYFAGEDLSPDHYKFTDKITAHLFDDLTIDFNIMLELI